MTFTVVTKTSIINLNLELGRNAKSGPKLHPTVWVLTTPPSNSDSHSYLRIAGRRREKNHQIYKTLREGQHELCINSCCKTEQEAPNLFYILFRIYMLYPECIHVLGISPCTKPFTAPYCSQDKVQDS